MPLYQKALTKTIPFTVTTLTGQLKWSGECPIEQIGYNNTPYSPATKSYNLYSPCTHWKCEPGTYEVPINNERYNSFIPTITGGVRESVHTHALAQVHLGLDFQSNNSFELIPFLLDLDGTLAMATRKFWKELNYGAVTWGVLPFVSDLKSIANSCKDVYDGINSSYQPYMSGKRLSRAFPFTWVEPAPVRPNEFWQASGVIRISGYVRDVETPDTVLSAFLVYLDELGLNIDAKTLWDVIPFSFVADYFLPVGDFLESLHPRGWFNPTFRFDGMYSIKYKLVRSAKRYTRHADFNYDCFYRDLYTGTLPSRPNVQPDWTCPSLKEFFNTLYLSKSIQGASKSAYKRASKSLRPKRR